MIRYAATALLLATALLACRVETAPPVGDVAPDFTLERLQGGTVSLAGLRGKTVLIDFWATWCPPCVLEIPELNAFYAEHRDDGLEVLAISIDEQEPEELAAWADEKGIQYPVALGNVDVAMLYGAEMFPFHILVSPEGRIVERLTPGYHDREELAELLARHAQ